MVDLVTDAGARVGLVFQWRKLYGRRIEISQNGLQRVFGVWVVSLGCTGLAASVASAT